MIKLFSKIRKKTLAEGQTWKYFKYAIGEIVLVVIGILIALSINSWNQTRKDAQKEDSYLQNLTRDLESQIESIDIQLSYEQKYEKNAKLLLNAYHGSGGFVIDSVTAAQLNILVERKTFVRTDPTFEDLISTGNIGLLKNITLRNELIEFYQELERYERILHNNNTLMVDEMYGQNIIQFIYIGGRPSQRLWDVSNETLKNPEKELAIINLIDKRGAIARFHIEFMQELRGKTKQLIHLIHKTGDHD